ncbi:MAG TPA: NADH-quinone oxidoreductase subunit NuoH [Candidatus Paceibacterota bacterium]|nr:NADH-quinone oxidoreductase subunit NuoH [Verrucomicrobiota bacterium]HOX01632.1 NADH-quinone oxidoreductase subunit NuoH [Verrucomicrobiota bacterium]HRZ43934.1 NADH-quinone oxidoreductase subunit NuoH [Candidatus Paceibacterota bacterium]HRZ93346.1 NADH-quinone oxidoreductase subunit NuoH [Candidatus Paceibacterota bacterium]
MTPTLEFFLFSALKVVAAASVLMAMVAYTVLAERRISAFVQDRIGPNRVGPAGLFQPLADAIKAFLKEDFVPGHVRKFFFWLAPVLVMLPGLLSLAVIPFGSRLGSQPMVIADLNVGILYTFGIVSLGVYGIVLAGYGSNSKYPFLGGVRSSAQMISYEVAMALSTIPVFMIVGDLNLSRVIGHQAGGWSHWMVFQAPLSFILFIAAAFAETNRLPFDLPEAENELVAGHNTEYSSIKFALFFMGEYSSMIAMSAMTVTLFFGGWTLPVFGLDQPAATWAAGIAHIAVFLSKVALMVCLMIYVRWMWPRFRYDQLMDLGWRRFVPLGLANILATALVLWARG